ncbi:MAG: TonB-dependent receptor domain-containing protein, partial [Rhodothermia bacterium]
MRRGRKLGLVTGFLVMAVGVSTLPTVAQVVTISADEVSLSMALGEFSKRTGVSVVYADRLIAGMTVSCQFVGSKLQAALNCLLGGTGLEARWSRDDQVVLSRIPLPLRLLYLAGKVFDAESKEPLSGAYVILTDRSSGVVTDEYGRYRIDGVSSGRVSLLFSHLGYESQELTFQAGERGETVLLKPQAIEGVAVVVEESRKTQDDDLSRMTKTVVENSDGIGLNLEGGEFGLATAATPGISRTGEISGQFVVRGGLPDQNVFKLDGATVYQPWHSQGLFSILQPSTVRGINLFAGPLPVDQGGYLASVLDAELSAGGPTTSTTAAISSTFGEVAISTPLASGVTAMVAGRRSHPGLNRTFSQSLPNNQQLGGGSFYDVAAKVGIRSTPNNQFFFTVYRGSDNLNWNAGPNGEGDTRADRWTNGVYAFKHRYVTGGRLMVSNSFYVSTFDAFSSESGGVIPAPTSEANDSQHVRDVAMKIDIDYILAPNHSLKTGVELAQRHLKWTDRNGADQYRDEVMEGAVFAHDTWRLTQRLVVRPGIRLSWFGNGVGVRPEPRFHAMYNVTDATSLHASWSYQVQYLHQINDISSGGLGSTLKRWMVSSNDVVLPSTGQQANFGVTAQAGPRWSVSADLYWRDFENV